LSTKPGIKFISGLLIASMGLSLSPVSTVASSVSAENLVAGIVAEVSGSAETGERNIQTPIAAASKLTDTALALLNGEILEVETEPAVETTLAAEEETTVPAEETSAVEETEQEEKKTVKRGSDLLAIYKSIAISQVSSYVNVRKEASADSEAVGKLYNNSAAKILDKEETEDGLWYRISSGSVKGYVKASYFVTGSEAEALAMELGRVNARIKAASLRLREKPDLSSDTITVLSRNEIYMVEEVGEEFTKVLVDDDLAGYVHNDYIEIDVDFDKAISLEEEQQKKEEEERKEKAAREAEERLQKAREESQKKETTRSTTKDETKKKETTKAADTTSKAEKETTKAVKETTRSGAESERSESTEETERRTTAAAGSDSGDVSSELRDAIVAYACSFVGKLDYVWGGNSLETGADCSGFVQQVFKKFGISLPRGSEMQGVSGKEISSADMRPGDIVYYGGHISIYIGDGQVVHASSSKSVPNTKISVWNYRSVESIRNVIGD